MAVTASAGLLNCVFSPLMGRIPACGARGFDMNALAPDELKKGGRALLRHPPSDALDQAKATTGLRRLRSAPPKAPKPMSIIAHDAGSGTAEVIGEPPMPNRKSNEENF